MATQVVRYVDPDAVGLGNGTSWANAYTSLNAASLAEGKDITATGSDQQYTFYCRSSGGSADTTAVGFRDDGPYHWVSDATNYIEIIGADFPADGIWNASAYRLEVPNNFAFTARASNVVHLSHLQITGITSGAGFSVVYYYGSGATGTILNCILKTSRTAGAGGVRVVDVYDTTVTVWNTVIYKEGAAVDDAGAVRTGGGNLTLYNCTVFGFTWGLFSANGVNCISGNNGDDFAGGTISYCCSDDGDGDHSNGPSGGNWANEFNNAAGSDFSLKLTGNCYGTGLSDPGSGLYSDDIIGRLRTVWSRGAYEAGSVLVVTPPKFHHYNKNAGGC